MQRILGGKFVDVTIFWFYYCNWCSWLTHTMAKHKMAWKRLLSKELDVVGHEEDATAGSAHVG